MRGHGHRPACVAGASSVRSRNIDVRGPIVVDDRCAEEVQIGGSASARRQADYGISRNMVSGMPRNPEDALLVRMTPEQKEVIREAAQEAGLTMRAYALHKLLGLDFAELPSGRPGRVPRREQELPMTG